MTSLGVPGRVLALGTKFHAQGPSQRWHLWILDVDGIRVRDPRHGLRRATSATHQAELQAIVDSITIEPSARQPTGVSSRPVRSGDRSFRVRG